MSDESNRKASLKQKAKHEFEEFAVIFLYLAFFFSAVATYSLLLLNQFHLSYYNYATALINALVIAKVILIGEYARLGKKHESKPLFVSALNKAFLFGLLVFGFHIIEEVVDASSTAQIWRQPPAMCASMNCSPVALSFSAFSFHFLRSGNCGE